MRKGLAAMALAAIATPAAAQETVVGLSAAITGAAAGTYAPVVEALTIYVDRLNAAGGVNGAKVKLVVQDDGAEPSKAAANAKKLVGQDKAVMVLIASLSSTYAPMVAETKANGVPLVFAGAVCPKESFPPADPLQYCTTAFGANYDSRGALAFVKETGKAPIKIGFSAMAIPISRGEIDNAEALSKTMEMTPVAKEIIPPPTPDYTPFATKIKEAGADWVYSWAPWVTQIRTFEALRRLGWQGSFIAYAHVEAENELARVKDPSFYAIGANAFFQDGLPVQKEIEEAAKKANAKYPVNQMAEGWVAGMALEAALKAAGPQPTAAKLATAMQSLKVDTKGLRGSAMEWTNDNHFRTNQSYRVYRWDAAKGSIARAKDWVSFEVK